MDTIHHIKDVMRVKVGFEFEAVNNGEIFKARVTSLNPFEVKIVEEIKENRELKGHLTLAFSLLKGGHDELILQKGTELGVYAFVPYISSRTIVRLNNEKEKENKIVRYKKILENSSEQCKRSLIPEISPVIKLEDLPSFPNETKLIAYEEVAFKGSPLEKEIGDDTLLVIGPEGGFSEKEAEYLIKNGFKPVSLGKRILRAETAAIASAALYSFNKEQ